MNDDLDDLLSDLAAAAGTAAAHGALGDDGTTVQRIARRVRRRRTARRAGAGAVVACAAGAVAFGAVQLRGGGLPSVAPPVSTAGAEADWPAQFDRCGKPVRDGLDSAGDVTLAATVRSGTGKEVQVRATATGPADPAARGWVYGTELMVTDDAGVVVGVYEGPALPGSDQIDDFYANVDFAAQPFPLASDVTFPLVSCAQYPEGTGDPALAPGDYDLWVTQSVGYTVDGTEVHARASVDVPLVVGPDGTPSPGAAQSADPTAGTPAEQYFACGEPVDLTIHTLPDAGGLTLAADLPATGWGERPASWSVTVGTHGGAAVTAHGSPAGSLALVGPDGDVAGFVVPARGPLRTIDVGPRSTEVLHGPTRVLPCEDEPLRGTYTAWPFVVETTSDDATSDGEAVAAGPQVVVVANPQAVTFGS
ncbi:hypothetical protein [Cellulomonas edaphi]|uniref:DUF4179 domain-containing protein n=1 Tax=Cellulomonas edaphi TaxID=3053468 RepID=A0ABT7S9H6_9CELL|nr:hypothetical protein [Cellulomons edaphi]MDM7832274.1 hypothetical protein [Cellulomons edaphi]